MWPNPDWKSIRQSQNVSSAVDDRHLDMKKPKSQAIPSSSLYKFVRSIGNFDWIGSGPLCGSSSGFGPRGIYGSIDLMLDAAFEPTFCNGTEL